VACLQRVPDSTPHTVGLKNHPSMVNFHNSDRYFGHWLFIMDYFSRFPHVKTQRSYRQIISLPFVSSEHPIYSPSYLPFVSLPFVSSEHPIYFNFTKTPAGRLPRCSDLSPYSSSILEVARLARRFQIFDFFGFFLAVGRRVQRYTVFLFLAGRIEIARSGMGGPSLVDDTFLGEMLLLALL